jgi:threonine aldolase
MPQDMPLADYSFASDNTSGLCPEALAAFAEANAGFMPSYGEDPWTAEACAEFGRLFECDCEIFFVFNGTAANALALSAMCQSYHSVIACETAHVETDECGAPEFFSNGLKLLLARSLQGRLDPGDAEHLITRRRDIHYPKPKVLSITQSTELGTLYRPAQLKEVSELAKAHGLLLHMDGSRLANAVASLECSLPEITWKAGVDVLCFGGTKNGIGLGEAVIFFNRELAHEFEYRCKQAGQLASKMRFMAAPWSAALRSGGWLKNARQANLMAQRLGERISTLPGARLLYPVEANTVFVELPERAHGVLREAGWRYYRFIGGGARFACSWSTAPEQVDRLADAVRAASSSA